MSDIAEPLLALSVPIASLTLDPANARAHGKVNIQAIRDSLTRFGQRLPIVVQKEGMIVRAGNGRVLAAKEMGWTDIAAVVVDESAVEATAFALTDNRTSELAEWDDDALRATIAALDADGVQPIGWDDKALGGLLKNLDPIAEDNVPEVREDATTKLGQLWSLGGHRVLCADTKTTNYRGLAADPDAVVTDPPYGIGFGYESHDDDRKEWFALMDVVVPKMRAAAPFVIMPCCGIDRMGWWYARHAPDWLVAWYKGSPGHRSHVGFNDWEAMLVWGKPHKQMHDYFQTECGFSDADGHPCPKPVAWGAWLVDRAAPVGGSILDPFLGSGTTLIACEQLGRTCFGIEIEPRYVDVTIQRWSNLTGQKAELVT